MAPSTLDHPAIIEAALADPSNVAVTFPDSDVNAILASRYNVVAPSSPFTYTFTQLWDMEVKKAFNPEKYLRPIIRQGSLKVLNHHKEGSIETFTRVSDQRTFLDFEKFNTVIEAVRINHDTHNVWFVGLEEVEDTETGEKITAGSAQPLFHVVHGAVGTEERPVDTWKVVMLTQDEQYQTQFEKMSKNPFLSLYNEIYLKEDMGLELTRKE